MSLHGDRIDHPSVSVQNNNNNSAKPMAVLAQPPASTEMRKSPVQLALEREEQTEPVGLYKGGSIQSKSFKLLEQELVDGERRSSTVSPPHEIESEPF